MMRAIVLSLVFTAAMALPSRAVELPEIPDSLRILTQLEVKNYWVNMMPEPKEPSRLSRGYHSEIVFYHQQVGERHRLIQAIRAGDYDRYAKLVMLRHNLQAYLLVSNDAMVAKVTAELAELEAIEQREEAERANADRLERLIAATERLAAAIENNGGILPADAQQIVGDDIVPFEQYDDHQALLTYLYDEIAICNQPIIVHHGHKPHKTDNPAYVHPPNSYPDGDPRGRADRKNLQPSTRPNIDRQPILPEFPGTRPVPSKPQQPQVRPAPARQPQTRPAPAPTRQPQVRPAPAPRQPQVVQPRVRSAR